MRSSSRIVAVLSLALLGCGILEAPAKDKTLAEDFIANLITGDSAALVASLDPVLTTPDKWPQVLAVRDSFLAWDPDSMRLIGWNVVSLSAEHTAELTYQLHGAHGWFLASVNLGGTPERARVRGIHWQQLPDRLDQIDRFTLAGKPLGAYLTLLMALTAALVSIGTALIVIFSGIPRRWLWAVVALLGCTRFDLNWTTGATGFHLFTIQLFSAGFQRVSAYAPWIISVSFPFGAMLAWRRILTWRRRHREAHAAAA